MRVLVMTAVAPERDAVQRGLGHDSRFEFALAGVGLAAAAVNGAMELAKAEYDLVVIAGIAGGFVGQAEIGSLVVASEIIAADLAWSCWMASAAWTSWASARRASASLPSWPSE